MTSPSFFAIAFSWPVVRRSLLIAAVVGTILIAINHGGAIYCGQFDSMCAMKCSLTMVVPYCVSTLSSVLACRAK
ncbi:MAG: nitrate/nitrite transporter NrtS [Planctomycetota bacterium]